MRMTSSRPFYPLLVVLVLAGFPALGSTQSKVWMGKEKDYERFLTNAEIVSVKDVGSGVNQPKRITLRQGARELDALWKSIQRGPKEWAWESFEAEVAAYQLDRILGLHMVPPTVVRSIQGQEGSLQLWVTGVKFFRDTSADAPQTQEWDQQLVSCQLFDNLIANVRSIQGPLWVTGPRHDDELLSYQLFVANDRGTWTSTWCSSTTRKRF